MITYNENIIIIHKIIKKKPIKSTIEINNFIRLVAFK